MYTSQAKPATHQNIKPTLADMLHALTSESREQREMASAHLASFGEAASMGLVMALRHPELDVRMRAVCLLGEIRVASGGTSNLSIAVPELVKLLDDRDLAMVAAAATTLGKIGGEVAVAGLCQKVNHRSTYVRGAVVSALAQVSTLQAMPELMKASQDKQAEVRAAATFGLARLKDNRVLARLNQLLQDLDAEVRWHAKQGLEEFGLDSLAI